MAKAKGKKQTSVAPTTATSCQLTGSDIASMSFHDLDSLIKAGTDRIVLNRTEAKKIRETLAPVIVRAYEMLLKNQGARTDLDPSLPTVEKWMEQNNALGSPSTFYRILRKAKVIPPQIGDAVTTPDGNIAKISHLHVTDPNRVDVEEMLPNEDQPVVRTYELDDLKPIKLMPVYCAKTPDGWDVDVAMSGAHKPADADVTDRDLLGAELGCRRRTTDLRAFVLHLADVLREESLVGGSLLGNASTTRIRTASARSPPLPGSGGTIRVPSNPSRSTSGAVAGRR